MRHLLTIFVLLLALTCCTTEADRNRMRAALDSINGRNRSGQPFTVKDVQPYVEFFDDHGTPNDRLLSHYLLGLAYYDHGEAPMALQCYQDAADCADTTAADCDYAQLARIYGQMAQVFYDQGLYRQQLDYDNLSVKFAWKGKDTLLAIRNNEQVIYAYRMLGIVDSVIYIFQHVSNLYRKYGYNDFAARTLVSGMRTLINNEEYATVKNYIDIYEKESDYFDFDGNIEHGREIYYNVKGLYYLGIGKLDSARYFFQKEINKGKDFNNQNAGAKGLALLYQKQHLPDSSAKYALYAYSMLDSLYAQRTTKEVERMQAMYDYGRHQQIAHQKIMEAQKEKEALRLRLCAGYQNAGKSRSRTPSAKTA
jgi:tetratricopeptide (TPR) repeat protein